MKNMLLRISGMILFNCQIAFAWPGTTNYYEYSALEIKSQGAGLITVAFDQQHFPQQTKFFSISQIEPGNHLLEIFTDRLIYHGYYATHEQVKIFSGNVYIQPASLIKGAIDNYGRFYIRDVDPLVLCSKPPQPVYDPYQEYNQYPPATNYAPLPMQANDFAQLKKVISDQWYDDTRLSVAKQALQNNWFTTAQIASIMDIFWYEDSKLAFAKAAYPKVTDKQNYFIVNKEFWYSSSVEELNEFLSTH